MYRERQVTDHFFSFHFQSTLDLTTLNKNYFVFPISKEIFFLPFPHPGKNLQVNKSFLVLSYNAWMKSPLAVKFSASLEVQDGKSSI